MSTTIDERVVEMRFDNRQFESNVSTTMSTLEKLKHSLKLDGASKGLEEVNHAANKVNFSGITSGIEAVNVKFSYLQASIQHQLNKIVDSAVATGKRMASALTIDPIKTGFSEYETQINAVQTILANTSSKGTTLQQVNSALDTLNKYADKTIYNFTEMTKNIGTFTAAGVDLETSVSAIQGIANLAAVSGSTSQQASTAMYQLSQALSSGTVKLMDWNSVVNAGMGGQVFQDALKQTARVHGIAIDDMIKKNGSFRETLQKGWLTSEILTETLNQFTMAAEEGSAEWEAYKKSLMDTGYTEEQALSILKMANTATDAATKVKTFTQLWDTLKESAQSGWTESWEIMIGDFEEAKGFLTDVSDRLGSMIGESAEARNKVLTEGLSSGWKQLLGAGIADEAGYKDIFKSVAKDHGTSIDDMIAAEKKLDDSLTDTEAFQKALKTGFKDGSISADMLTESVHKMADKMSNMSAEELKAAGYTQDYVKQIKELSAGLKDGSISMDNFVNKMMRSSGRENIIQALWNAFDGLMSVIKPIKEAFREIFPPITGEQVYKLTERIRDLTAKFKLSKDQAAKLKSAFKGVFSVFAMGFDACKALAKGALDLLRNFTGFGGKVLDASASIGDFLSNLRNSAKETNFFGSIVDKVVGFLTNAITKIKEFGQSLKVGLNSPDFSSTLGFFKGLWSIIAKVGSAITKTFGSIGSTISEVLGKGDIFEVLNSGLIAGILLGINKFTSGLKDAVDNVGGFMENVTGILDEVRGCFEAYQQQLKAGALLKIAAAIGILAASLFLLSTIDADSLGTAIAAITVLFAELVGSMALMNKFGGKSALFDTTVVKMVAMSVSILILASALKALSGLSWEQMAVGLVAISALLWELVAVSVVMSKTGSKMVKGSLGLIMLAAAIKILAAACKDFATMSWEGIGKGLAAIGGLLLEISVFENIAGKAKHVVSTGVSLVIIAASLKLLANVLDDFGSMDPKVITTGLIAIGAALLELAIAMNLMPKNSMLKATGLLITVASLKLLASALSDFGGMDPKVITTGLIAIGAALLELAIAMNLMPKNSMLKATGLLITVASLKLLASALSDFGGMEWGGIGKGLAAMGGALAELAIGLNLMKGTLSGAAALLVAAVALAIITPVMTTLGGMSWGEIAKGLLVLAGAFTVIGVAGLLLQPLIVPILGLAAAFVLLGVGMLGIGAGLTLVAAGISALAVALSAGAASIVAALTVIVTGILELVPTIARIIGEGIVELAKVIGEYAPQLADSFLKLLLGVLQSLAENAPQITDALFDLLIGVINSLSDHTPALIEALITLFSNVFKGLVDALKSIGMNSLRDGIDAALGLSALMLAMSVALKVAGSVSIGSAIKGILALTAMAVPLLAFVAVLALASGIDNAMNNALALTVLAGACTVMLGVLTIIGFAWPAAAAGIIALTAMAIPMLAFVGVLAVMNNVENAMANAMLLGTFMRIMADVLVKVALVAPLAILGVTAMTGLTLLMGAIGVMAVAIGALMEKFPSIQKFLDAGLPVLEQLAGSIGTMIGKFIGGIGEGLGDSLVKIGVDIAAFMAALSVASTNASMIKGESFDGVKQLMDVMGDIALTTVGTSIGDIFTLGGTSMEKFQTDGVAFFNAMKAIGEASSGVNIDAESMNSVIGVAQKMADLQSSLEPIGGVMDWFTGRDDLATFGTNAGQFVSSMKTAFGSLDGVTLNTEAMNSIVGAASSLVDLQTKLEPIGGVITWFTGRDDLGTFGFNVGAFIYSMKTAFSSLDGVEFNTEAMNSIISASTSLARLQSSLESVGGVVDWFTGRDDLGTFGTNAAAFITSMKTAMASLDGVELNTEAMDSIISAATSLADLQSSLEPIGGVITWFTGRDDLGTFGLNIGTFISSMVTAFSSLEGAEFNTEAMDSIISAATSLARLQSSLESVGGVITWFTGRDDLGTFGLNIGTFISSMVTAFSSLEGAEFNTEAMDSIISAATSLARLQSSLESVGGVVDWFTGRDDLGTFGTNAAAFITSMKTAMASLDGAVFNEEAMSSVINAATSLAGLQSKLEPMGGVVTWFSGRSDLGTFGTNIGLFADAMGKLKTGMGENGISEAVVASVTNAGTAIIELQKALPEEGWFDGKMNLSEFSDYVTDFATAMSTFSTKATEIDSGAVSTVISTAYRIKSLINSLVDLDTSGLATFTGVGTGGFGADGAAYKIAQAIAAYSNKVADIDIQAVSVSVSAAMRLKSLIANLVGLDTSGIENFKLGTIGSQMKNYADKVSGIDTGTVSSSISAANRLKNFISSLAGLDTSGIKNFKVSSIGSSLKSYAGSVSSFNAGAVSSSISAANRLRNFISSLAGMDSSGVGSFKSAIDELATVNIADLVAAFSGASAKLSTAGADMINGLIKGMQSKLSDMKSMANNMITSTNQTIRSKATLFSAAGQTLATRLATGISSKKGTVNSAAASCVSGAASGIRGHYSSFYSAGGYLGDGLVRGINAKKTAVYWAGYELGKKAVDGEKAGQNSNSPSKETIKAGKWLGEGLVIGMEYMGKTVYNAGESMGQSAVNATRSAMTTVLDALNADMDAQPTIRPVVDLSDVQTGVAAVSGMFNTIQTVGVRSNLNSTSAVMNRRLQNGTNDDIISAINKLGDGLEGNRGDTYHIDGITYDDGSNISEAVQTLVRAAKMGRRV